MKQKQALMLIELVVMLLVFALAAALCLQAFAWAQTTTLQSSRKDLVYNRAQEAAEQLKNTAGDYEALGGRLENGSYHLWLEDGLVLRAEPLQLQQAGLGGARICVYDAEGSCLVQLEVCWQEEVL